MSFLKASAKLSAPSPTPSTSSSSGAKRKRDEAPINGVYSQPQDTGTGQHIYTQFTYTIEHLKADQRWFTLKEILGYLNIREDDITMVRSLEHLFRSNNDSNRIEWDRRNNLYRYRPKYNIRNAAELKGWLQNQKSAAGLPVKDLKDGWPGAADAINELEKKQEVLVGRHKKDNQPKTVWINDPSLMHKMDPEFQSEWHKIQLPPNPDDLRSKLISAGLKPSSTARKPVASGPKEKKRKAARKGGKQTNTHMASILKDFSHLRK
jgi:transcription initiation factor TFIIE subunit beta